MSLTEEIWEDMDNDNGDMYERTIRIAKLAEENRNPGLAAFNYRIFQATCRLLLEMVAKITILEGKVNKLEK